MNRCEDTLQESIRATLKKLRAVPPTVKFATRAEALAYISTATQRNILRDQRKAWRELAQPAEIVEPVDRSSRVTTEADEIYHFLSSLRKDLREVALACWPSWSQHREVDSKELIAKLGISRSAFFQRLKEVRYELRDWLFDIADRRTRE